MKPIDQCTVAVLDHGLFLHVARRLARDCAKVYYWTPHEKSFPTVRDGCFGDGYPDVERVNNFWSIKDRVDFWCFPDIGFAGLQNELRSQGCMVWGAGAGDSLEINREKFLKALELCGLPVPPHEAIEGMENLREFLKDKTDKWIKISKWRGDWETLHWRSWDEDSSRLDYFATKFGPLKEQVVFYVFDPIETEIEDGFDTWFCGGKFPSRLIHAMEAKDKAAIATFCDANELPDPVKEVLGKFAAALGQFDYNGLFSAEIRIIDDTDFYFTDPTCRAGSPLSQSMVEMVENFSEVIQAGAGGECLEPIEAAAFAMQLMVKIKRNPAEWFETQIPEELDRWFKPTASLMVDGKICWPPNEDNDGGWLVAIGDSIEECLEELKARVELLPDSLEADLAPMGSLFEELKEAEKMEMEFSSDPIPAPGSVL